MAEMTKNIDKLEAGALFLEGLMEALRAPLLSYRAIGVWVRIADDDSQCLTARVIAERSPMEDEKVILAALHELERAGFVRLELVQEADGTWTTSARMVFDQQA
jgi:hypothetical protein